MSNILIAFKNLIENPDAHIVQNYTGNNRANNMGDGLEDYIKDLFSGSYGKIKEKASAAHRDIFSYLGNKTNPPDMILNNGDAIEVKKLETIRADIALNSSHPKQKLESKSPLITKACRDSDGGNWVTKDILYAIGVAKKNQKGLWFIYGDCYAAAQEVYENVKTRLVDTINQGENIELAETKEFARANKVDPLGITYLRIRGMWGIENPIKVFDYLNLNTSSGFFCHIIMRKSKYDSLPTKDKDVLNALEINQGDLQISQNKIYSPDNPAVYVDVMILSFNL